MADEEDEYNGEEDDGHLDLFPRDLDKEDGRV